MPYRRLAPPALIALAVAAVALGEGQKPKLPPPAKRQVDFAKDVEPILARCVGCHGPEKQRGGLRLDDGEAALVGGDSGKVIRPGHSGLSLLIDLVAGLDADRHMPPDKKKKLSDDEIGVLRAWIDQGAAWPKKSTPVARPKRSSHWSFQPVRPQRIPAVNDPAWTRNPIDAFVLARLEKEKIAPSPQADAVTLMRRAHLDLIGLPPSPEEVDAFLADESPGAYERLIDRLLSSPHYGERWGRHWLDLARYADSDGYEKDTGRPFAWRYRHWVIAALNDGLSYDRLTIEQLAGDLLPGATTEQKVATGFHRNTLTNREGGVDREQFRVEATVDRVNTTARVWLGLTLGCAQCHDHKYDPLAQREYYQFFAFFNSDLETDVAAPLPGYETVQPPPAKKAKDDTKAKPAPVMAQTIAQGKPRKTYVMVRGDFLRPGVEVKPSVPAALSSLKAKGGTRLDLARWLVSRDNPLTARVAVNWVWHKHFGRGLVPTLEDFGTQGEKPSHPELLDWLAGWFVDRGWSLKELHRLILTSATYRQSSRFRPEVQKRDPSNALLARQTRLRLEAEAVRDAALASSGLLTRTIGGPSVRPPQPSGVSELTYAGSARWVESGGADRYRRGLYVWFQRTSPFPMLMTFDAPDSNLSCVRRERSNTPLQALTTLNDVAFVECALALGRRVLAECKGGVDARLKYAFRLCTARTPTRREQARLRELYDDLLALCKADPDGAKTLAGAAAPGATIEETAAWAAVGRALLNLDEVVTRE
jgi:hypothetical protein